MSNEVKKYKAHICGVTYDIVSDESQEDVLSCVKNVHARMRDLQDSMPGKSQTELAVLVALQVSLEYEKLMQQRQHEFALSSKIMDALDADSIG